MISTMHLLKGELNPQVLARHVDSNCAVNNSQVQLIFSDILWVIREDIQLSVIMALKKRQRRRRRRPTADVVQSVAASKTTKQDDFDFGNREGGKMKFCTSMMLDVFRV